MRQREKRQTIRGLKQFLEIAHRRAAWRILAAVICSR
jgi:hypothetical protein